MRILKRDEAGKSVQRKSGDAGATWKDQVRDSLRGQTFAEGSARLQLQETEQAAEGGGLSAQEITNEIFQCIWPGFEPPAYSQAAGDFAAFCLAEAVRASRKLDFVPRPPGSKPGIAWLLIQAIQIAWRKVTRSTEIYVAVRNVVANNQRVNYDMLRNGLEPNY
jgi:hypothetical protein